MAHYNTVNIRDGSEVDVYLTELVGDNGPIESYSQAGRYAIRQRMQAEEDNE